MTDGIGQDIDVMYETDASNQWEEMNSVQDCPELDEALDQLADALLHLYRAEDNLNQAAAFVDGTPECDKLVSLAMYVATASDSLSKLDKQMRG